MWSWALPLRGGLTSTGKYLGGLSGLGTWLTLDPPLGARTTSVQLAQ